MNNEIEQLQKDIANIQARLDEAQEKLKRLKQGEPWKPANGDTYYFIDTDGCVERSAWGDCVSENACLAVGNCFRTEEEAEPFAEAFRTMRKTPPLFKYGEPVSELQLPGQWATVPWRNDPYQIAMWWMGILRKAE